MAATVILSVLQLIVARAIVVIMIVMRIIAVIIAMTFPLNHTMF